MKNKTHFYLFVLITFLFISLNAPAQNKVYTTTVKHHNVYFVQGQVVLDAKGFVTQGVLGADFPFAIEGSRVIKFQKGNWVRFNEKGNVYEGFLANDHPLTVIGGRAFLFKKGTMVKFNPKGLLYEGTIANAISMTLSDNRNVTIPAGTLVHYDEKGRVSNYKPK